MHTNKNSQQLPIAAPDIIRAFQKDYPNIDYELLSSGEGQPGEEEEV